MKPKVESGQSRVLISHITPTVDNGRYAVKRIVNEPLQLSACLVADGHDIVSGQIAFKKRSQKKWNTAPLSPTGNDFYAGAIEFTEHGFYDVVIKGYIDYALTWQHGLEKKHNDGQDILVELNDGKKFFEHLKSNKSELGKNYLKALDKNPEEALQIALSQDCTDAFKNEPYLEYVTDSQVFPVWVDAEKAGFSAWYEFFPRSLQAPNHGKLKDVINHLPRVADLGFDVLYLPPVHPIGEVNRKGKNNATTAEEGDVGSPWGIGSKFGGHKSIHPDLGTIDDFKELIKTAKDQYNIDIALDLAYQAAPDHPYVKEHPEWFKWKSDGTVQYAENPPKKYQDILPIYFESTDWKGLWEELLDVILFWVKCGITIFRVDNPHTKSINFWEWAIEKTHEKHPEVIFLAEAFTKPALMHQLAKAGFNQSYTYFTWRNSKYELETYMNELTKEHGSEYFRPNFWPNTPDILPYALQSGNQSVFLSRLFLAATLSSNYGVYGPVYELMQHEAVPGKEEYAHSEKYQISQWDWNVENSLTWLMRILNQQRKKHKSLQSTKNISPLYIENDQIIAYAKQDGNDVMLMVCSLDAYHTQDGWVQLPNWLLEKAHNGIEVHDVCTGNTFQWHQEWNYVKLEATLPFHFFEVSIL